MTTTPEPLLRRPELMAQVRGHVARRQPILLAGTVHKGKTTIAQLVVAELCPTAWWFKFSGRRPDQVDTLLRALAQRVEGRDCPAVVVIDDLDTSPSALAVYGTSLASVLHRLTSSGRVLLATAQGSTESMSASIPGLAVAVIPALTESEIADVCLESGCPDDIVKTWAAATALWTGGHPKLVQVRIGELTRGGWPEPGLNDLVRSSTAIASVRQMSRRLLSGSQPPEIAEYLYLAAELTVSMDRQLAKLLANVVPGIRNAGDVIDKLTGQWLEVAGPGRVRPTPLLSGSAKEVWSVDDVKKKHGLLHDVIRAKRVLNELEAAAMFFHAYMSGDQPRIALSAITLQISGTDESQKIVFGQLAWLPAISLAPGQRLVDDPFVESTIRGLQFKVAQLLDEQMLESIADRWADAISAIKDVERRLTSEAMLWGNINFYQGTRLPLRLRLEAIAGFQSLQSSPYEVSEAFTDLPDGLIGLPQDAKPADVILVMLSSAVKGLEPLLELIDWLECTASDVLRTRFEEVLSWPMLQMLGAFVHGAWAAVHESTTDWQPWLSALDRAQTYARSHSSPNFGREIAKAKAIILAEHMAQPEEALAVIEAAEMIFGPSAVLTEQRANVLFHAKDDAGVLNVWEQLKERADRALALDPFAYRRVAMSAARMGKFDAAAQVFLEGAESIVHGEFSQTKFGLVVDAAAVMAKDRRIADSAAALCSAIEVLPDAAQHDGDLRWEAVQRAATEVCLQVKATWMRKQSQRAELDPGYVSSPALKMSEGTPGQQMRSDMLMLEVARLRAATGGSVSEQMKQHVSRLRIASIPYLRFLASQATITMTLGARETCGLFEALADLDAESKMLKLRAGDSGSLLESDEERRVPEEADLQAWFGVLAAAIASTCQPILEVLPEWARECRGLGHSGASLASAMDDCLRACARVEDVASIARDATAPSLARIVAARLALDSKLDPRTTCQLQGFLVSAAMSDQSYGFQEMFNRTVAARFARDWRRYMDAPFSLMSPRITLPHLEEVTSDVMSGKATLRDLLRMASMASSAPLGDYIDRVW